MAIAALDLQLCAHGGLATLHQILHHVGAELPTALQDTVGTATLLQERVEVGSGDAKNCVAQTVFLMGSGVIELLNGICEIVGISLVYGRVLEPLYGDGLKRRDVRRLRNVVSEQRPMKID
ncbi:hypothetical protein BJ546DRAFT_1071032 [Cryomyces antarcticus]